MAVDRNKLIASAQKYIQKGQIRKAIKDYEAIVAAYPDDIRVLLKIGDLQAREGLTSDAVNTYNEVADYYVAHGFFLKAVAVYKQLLRVRPEDTAAQMRLADLYAQLSLFSDALSQFQAVATQLQQEGKFTHYLQVLQRMVEIDPARVGNRIKLAEQLLKIEDQRAAAVHFGAACDSLLREGRFEEYIKVAERFVHQVPDDSDRIKQLARVYLEVGKPANAASTLQPLFRNDRYDSESLRLLIDSMVQLGQSERAATALRELIPVFEQHQRESERELALELLYDIDPNDPVARRHRGVSGFGEMQFEVIDGEPIVELSADQRATVARLISETDVYLKYSLFEKSLGHLDQVFQIDPSNVEALKRRSRIFADTHRPLDATRDLARLVRICCREEIRRAECEEWLREAARLAPDLPELAIARLEFDRHAGEVPELDADDLLVADPLELSPVPLDDSDGLDEFDALFEDIAAETGDAAGGSALDQDEDFIRDIESAFGDNVSGTSADDDVLAIETGDFLPAELDEALERASQLGEEGQLSDAHALLLELMGQWPEHAESILRRLDQLPSSEEVAAAQAAAGFEDIPSAVDIPTLESLGITPSQGVTRTVEVGGSAGGDDDLFTFDEDESPANGRDYGQPMPATAQDVGGTEGDDDDIIMDAEILDGDDEPDEFAFLDARPGIMPLDSPISFEPVSFTSASDSPIEPSLASLTRSYAQDESVLFDDEPEEDADFVEEESEFLVLDDADGDLDALMGELGEMDAIEVVDAPMGRPSTLMTTNFGPTAGALAAGYDDDFNAAVTAARSGQVLEALDALQEQLFGDFPVAASFELSVLRMQMGEYLDAAKALEALQNAPDLTETDVMLIQYYRSLCLEALSDLTPAREIWTALRTQAPSLFPDASIRLGRSN